MNFHALSNPGGDTSTIQHDITRRVGGMLALERLQLRQTKHEKHIQNIPFGTSEVEQGAAEVAHYMTPHVWIAHVDEIVGLVQLRIALVELEGLLGIAEAVRIPLQGKVSETYPAYLETYITQAIKDVTMKNTELSSSKSWIRLSLGDTPDSTIGSTARTVQKIHKALTRLDSVGEVLDDPNEWVSSLDRSEIKRVWQSAADLKPVMKGWSIESDMEMKLIMDQATKIWEIAASKDDETRALLGWYGV
ncbi:MAG: hypothetical protein Q9174_006799 [Haloplaca sp. 1 TL-2023]